MKILIDGHVLDGPPQGTTTYIAGIAKALAKHAEVYVCCKSSDSFAKYFVDSDNVVFVQLDGNNRYSRLTFSLPILVRKLDVDYLVVQYIAPIIKNCKLIVVTHDILFADFPQYFGFVSKFIKFWLYYLSAKRADIVCTVSKYSANRIEELFGIERNRLVITSNAVDTSKFLNGSTPVPYLHNKKFFLYVSRIEERKNHLLLLRALSKARDKNVNMVFVGSNCLTEQLVAYLSEHGLAKRVYVMRASDEELGWLYKNCLASLYPSHCEGFGIPPLEAVVNFCPSFAAENTALSELKDCIDGTFDSNSVDDVVKIINDVSDLPGKSIVSPTKIGARFNWDKSVQKLLERL